ncbi:hypothetical protein EUA06_06750 [Nocardioides glacieisoli]|uniref:Uncharacterized protein n=1 Tax=Nocardioides glacieisoli TaxID=1168730 RepID=A0A4Q2RXF0_9ACTN|nr:hypothetical protein [Nocardioides glacieisoli]RYB92634.1 hypothetical protein EUA06_06750 [Nocardioides glacieisoli]
MSSRRSLRQLLVAVLLGVLVGGGLMAVTPAGAEVSSAVATNWKKIWKKNLKPLADKRYYTKKQSDAKYSTKAETAAGDAASQAAANTATDSKLTGYYKKAEIDAKLAPFVNSVAANSGGDQLLTLGAIQTVRSVSLMPPSNGTVIVTSSAYVINTGAGASTARCSITPGTALDDPFFQRATIATPGDTDVIAATRGFAVTKGTLLTVNLVCDSILGTSDLRDSNLSAIFAPG